PAMQQLRAAGPRTGGTGSEADRQARVAAILASAGFDALLICKAAPDTPWPETRLPVLSEAGRFRLLDARGANLR
ncbi:hypothetical protein, partial [Sandarakinorhabdus rubra]|uniref:hypothetical protein n=1 Tax=Sandarakinorhabdus rubra TaxID=2672568 RepID=UPI0013D919CE